MDEASRFRSAAALANQDRPKTGWRYSPELRALAVEIFTGRREPLNAVATSLGISAVSLARWLEQSAHRDFGFREVSVVPAVEAKEVGGRIRITSPGGWAVDGLSFREAVELLRLSGC